MNNTIQKGNLKILFNKILNSYNNEISTVNVSSQYILYKRDVYTKTIFKLL
jgi:hypothetical protein